MSIIELCAVQGFSALRLRARLCVQYEYHYFIIYYFFFKSELKLNTLVERGAESSRTANPATRGVVIRHGGVETMCQEWYSLIFDCNTIVL